MSIKRDDLPPWAQQHVLRQARSRGETLEPAAGAGETKPRHIITGTYRNKWEEQYAKRLGMLQAAGDVLAWWYESITLKLADDCRYTPDFVVLLSGAGEALVRRSSLLEFVEVKGFKRDDAIVKFRTAAEQFGHLGAFVMVQRDGGGWKEIERIERKETR